MGRKADILLNFLPARRRKKLFFLHIAKCGGISINRALRYRYFGGYERLNARASVDAAVSLSGLKDAFEDNYESVLKYRENLLLYFLNERHPFISGHYAYSDTAYKRFGGEYAFMTLLRNPIDRFFSSYYFNAAKQEDSPWKIRESLEDFLNTPQATYLGADYVRLLGGTRESDGRVSDDAIQQAMTNLNKFDIIGVIERPDLIETALKRTIDVRIRIGHKNKGPVSAKKRNKELSDDILKKVRGICEPNMAVYRASVEICERLNCGSDGMSSIK